MAESGRRGDQGQILVEQLTNEWWHYKKQQTKFLELPVQQQARISNERADFSSNLEYTIKDLYNY